MGAKTEVKKETAVVFADGGSRGNAGPADVGAVVTVDGEIVEEFEKFEIAHVRSEQNKEADRLANEAMDKGCGGD